MVAGLVLLAGSSALAQEQRGAPPLRIPDGFGINIHFTRAVPGELEALGPSGNRFIRMDFAWGGIERKKGEYDFSAFDRLVEDMTRLNIRCLFILDYGNRLYDDGAAPHSDEARAAFARYAAAGAKRYAGKGIIWEIWNEPNLAQFWKPKPNVDDYCKLASVTIDAVRAADPNAYIVAPGSSGFPWEFLDAMGKAGVLAKLDGVSVHPYRQQQPETAEADYARLRVLINRYVPNKRLPIFSGEWGYSTAWNAMTEEKQANYLPRQRLMNLACGVPVSIWYDWRDDGLDPKEPEHHFGTVYRDFKPKSSYIAGKVLAETLNGYAYVRRIAMASEKDYVLLFRKGDEVALAAWTMSETHPVKLDVPAGEVTIVSRDGQRKSVKASDGLEVTLEQSPQYLLLPKSDAATMLAAWQPAESMIVLSDQKNAMEIMVDNPAGKVEGELRVMLDGQVLGKASVSVDRGQQQAVSVPLDYARRDQASKLAQVVLAPKGKGTTQSAVVWLLAPNPLKLSILPASGRTAAVLVENPSEQAANMELSIQGGTVSAKAPVVFKQGQDHAYITPKLPRPLPPDATLTARLTDRGGKLLALSEGSRWTSILPVESIEGWRVGLSGKQEVAGTATVNLAQTDDPMLRELGLPKTVEVAYQFGEGWKFAEVAPPQNQRAIDGKPTAVGLWVHGDGSGNTLRCKIKDSTGQVFQSTYGAVNWTGWKWITLKLAGPDLHHWGGANDGVIHYPVKWDSPLLIDNGNLKANQPLKIFATGWALSYEAKE